VNRRINTPFCTESYELAYLAAFVALGITPGADAAKAMAAITHTPAEVYGAVSAMRHAREGQRVFAALDALRAHRSSDTVPMPAPEVRP
jgi:hypothetical protein